MIRVLFAVVRGPLEPYAVRFAGELLELGYAPLSARNLLRVFGHFSRWLGARGLGPEAATDDRVAAFLRARRREARCTKRLTMRAMARPLEFLRRLGVAPLPIKIERRQSALDHLLIRYAEFLHDERSLNDSTIKARVATASRFLSKTTTRLAMQAIDTADVHRFMRRMARRNGASALAAIGSDLRSLLQFLFVEGIVSRDLRSSVPSSVGWRDRSVPRGLASGDLDRMLRSCDRRTLSGKRAFAILLLLSRLGLRQGEVAALTLDDFDWIRGEVVVGSKGKQARLPLPNDVGAAVAAYLVNRPRVTTRRVFLRLRAPIRPLKTVQAVVCASSLRAGIGPIFPHRLRHTAATEMLRRGASLGEIAEVLRHTSAYTTAIYAKVDRHALRSVVQPWAGAR